MGSSGLAAAAHHRSTWAREREEQREEATTSAQPSPSSPSPLPALPPPAFPLALRGMTSLRYINLNSCGLRAAPAFVAALRSLETADLEDNDLGESGAGNGHGFPLSSFPASLVMPRLGCLNVAQCKLVDLPPAVLRSMPGLRILDLTDNRLRERCLPLDLGARLPLLRAIGLKRNALAAVPRALGGAAALEEIYLEDNADLEVDAPLDFIADLPRLRVVMVGKQWGGGWSPRSLAHVADFAAKLRARHPRRDVLRISYPGASASAAANAAAAAAAAAAQEQRQEQERQRDEAARRWREQQERERQRAEEELRRQLWDEEAARTRRRLAAAEEASAAAAAAQRETRALVQREQAGELGLEDELAASLARAVAAARELEARVRELERPPPPDPAEEARRRQRRIAAAEAAVAVAEAEEAAARADLARAVANLGELEHAAAVRMAARRRG